MRSDGDNWQPLRENITGPGESSSRKTDYREQQRKTADFDEFRAILDHNEDAIFLIDTGDGHILDVSETACSQLGYDRQDLIGTDTGDIIDEGSYSIIRSLFAGRVQHVEIAATLHGRGGVKIPREVSVSTAHLEGRTIAVAMARDVTPPKPAGDEHKRPGDAYRAIFNALSDGVIVMDVDAGRIVDVNDTACRMFGYTRPEAMGTHFLTLLAGDDRQMKDAILRQLNAIASGPSSLFEAHVRGRDGKPIHVEINLTHGRLPGEDRIIAVVRDISLRKASDDRIRASLQEKEVMLKEIHHRVKNNLQVISSLLSIQSTFLADPRDAQLFQESRDRIRTMALVHEKLYQSSDLASVDFSSYIERLATNLFRSYGGSVGHVSLHLDVKDVFLDADMAVPCGLIVNELVTNALKYAFPGGRDGTVTIAMRQEGDHYVLEISDDGAGLPPGIDTEHTESLGLQLVNMLTSQLEGTVSVDVSRGTKFTIRFRKAEVGK